MIHNTWLNTGCNSLMSITTAPLMVLKSKIRISDLVSTSSKQHIMSCFLLFPHLMWVFGGTSVIWLWLGSMWWLWPFLTLARWRRDQLWGRLSVSHWVLFFKWQSWKCCQHIPFPNNVYLKVIDCEVIKLLWEHCCCQIKPHKTSQEN